MKAYGSPISTSSMRVLACLYEKELEFDFIFVDMRAGQHRKEPYISLNPFSKVPALEDGDLKLFESRAITKYIAHNYTESGTQLICKDSKKNAILVVWMEVEALQFDPVASQLTRELVVKPNIYGMPADEAVVEEYEAKLAKVLDIYEGRLAESKYMGGDSFTLADLHHIPNVYYLMGTRIKKLFDSCPHVSAWVADILARPAWLKVIAMQKKQ